MNDDETWVEGDHANTLNSFDAGDVRTTHAVLASFYCKGGSQQGFARDDNVSPTLMTESGVGITSPVKIVETFLIDDGRDLEKHQNGTGIGAAGDPAYTLDRQQRPAVAHVAATLTRGGHPNSNAPGRRKEDDTNLVSEHMSVRRLTPIECERLMGWPDEWTAPEGVKAPDSKRYAACGDGIVAPVAFWIADRIRMIEGEA